MAPEAHDLGCRGQDYGARRPGIRYGWDRVINHGEHPRLGAGVEPNARSIGPLYVKKDRGPLYLVVVGDSDPDFWDMLHVWFEEANGRFFSWPPFHLIEKLPQDAPEVTRTTGKANV